MSAVAYLTEYDGLLCGGCALGIDDLVNEGRTWLLGLTAISVAEVLQEWPEARCEECKRTLALSEARSAS